jgi:hypothetical protein
MSADTAALPTALRDELPATTKDLPKILFTGPQARAHQGTSPELMQWWAEHGPAHLRGTLRRVAGPWPDPPATSAPCAETHARAAR